MSLLEVKEIKKINDGNTDIKNISFHIEEKGICGFLCKNGSTNSLLAKILVGACETDAGHIFYKGKELYANEIQTVEIKKKIGFVASNCIFDNDVTVFEALDMVGRAKMIEPDKRYRQIKEALELTGMALRTEALVGELLSTEKKRLMIASSLLGNPEAIIMDEPLRSFEKKQADEIKAIIEMLGSKKVVLLFSTRPDEIEELCSHVIILHDGAVAVSYKKETLLNIIKENELGSLSSVLDALTEEKGESAQ